MEVTGRATQEAKAEDWGEGVCLLTSPHPILLPMGEGSKD
jgi:hypothetical protein